MAVADTGRPLPGPRNPRTTQTRLSTLVIPEKAPAGLQVLCRFEEGLDRGCFWLTKICCWDRVRYMSNTHKGLVVVHFLRSGLAHEEIRRFTQTAVKVRDDQSVFIDVGFGAPASFMVLLAKEIVDLFGLLGYNQVQFIGPDAFLFDVFLLLRVCEMESCHSGALR